MVTVVEKCVVSYVVSVKLADVPGGPLRLYITEEYKGGDPAQGGLSFWISRARRFGTNEEASKFIAEHGIEGAMVEQSCRTVEHKVIEE